MADLYDFPEIYDERFTDRANQAYKSHYEKLFSGKEIKTVLDCSFGTGNLTFPLAELGYAVSGSDLSASMLEKGREKAQAKGFQIPLTQCDFRQLSRYFSSQFDCVMSTGNAMAHVSNEDVVRTLREMDRLIRPGGYLYYDSRNWELELKDRRRFRWIPPFTGPDGLRINCVQDWDFHEDGSISINIFHGYERDGKIFDSNDFTEQYMPFPLDLARSTLKELGYSEPVIKPCPWFDDKPLEETGWYCLMAKKPE